MKLRSWLLVVVGGLGCGSDATPSLEEGEETFAICPKDSSLSYETFGRDFMQAYCVSCHSSELGGAARRGAPTDHDFDTLDAIREHVDHIALVAAAGPGATNAAMPIGKPKPTRAERELLGEWLACGAP